MFTQRGTTRGNRIDWGVRSMSCAATTCEEML